MKSYTDIEQSKKLATILPIKSADMWWSYYYDVVSDTGEYDKEPMLHKPICNPDKAIPCWSLTALLDILNYPMLVHEFCGSEKGKWFLSVYDPDETYRVWENDPIDACYEMIIKLNKQKLL